MPSPHHLLIMHILQIVGALWLFNFALIGAEAIRERYEAVAMLGTFIVGVFMVLSLILEAIRFK